MTGPTAPFLILVRKPDAAIRGSSDTRVTCVLTSAEDTVPVVIIVTSLTGFSSAGFILLATELKLARTGRTVNGRFVSLLILLNKFEFLLAMKILNSITVTIAAFIVTL